MRRCLTWAGLVVGFGTIGFAGCGAGKDPAQEGSSRVQALVPVVSGALDLERRVDLTPSVNWSHFTTCGVEQCLSVYAAQPRVDGAGYGAVATVGVRTDRAGNWLESRPVVFPTFDARSTNFPVPEWVVAQGPDFVVGIRPSNLEQTIRIFRLKPNGDVELLGSGPEFGLEPLCVTADRLVFRYGAAMHVQVFTAELVPLATPVPLNAGYGIVGSTTCLAYNIRSAVRLRLSDGVSLDPVPIAPSAFLAEWRQSGAYKAGNFVIVSPDEGDLVTFRIRESDGELLDRDDPLNERSGGRLIYADNASNGYFTRTFDWGSELFVTWTLANSSENVIVGARIDPATGRRVDGSTTTFESNVGSDSLGAPLYLTPSGGMLLARALGTPLSVQPGSPPVLSPVSAAARPFTYWLPNRRFPAAAATSTRYLVGWERDRSAYDPQAGSDVEVTRVDPTTGASLDAPALPLGGGKRVAIAGNGTDFLTAWFDGTSLQRRWVRADGTVEAPLAPIAAGTTEVRQTNLVFNGSRFALSWLTQDRTLHAVRLNSAGTALDSTPLIITGDIMGYGVTTDTAPSSDRRSFAFVYRYTNGHERVRLLRAQSGTLVDSELAIGQASDFSDFALPSAASDGPNIVLRYYTAGGMTLTRLDTEPPGGSIVDNPYPSSGLGEWAGNLWYDGRDYLLLEGDTSRGALSVRRFEASLEPLDSARRGSGQTVLSGASSTTFYSNQLASASVGSGRSLVVYSEFEPLRLGLVLKARLIENDGVSVGGAGGADGAGGSSGDAGTAGHGGPTTDGGAATQGGSGGVGAVAGEGGAGDSSTGGASTNGGTTNGGTTNGGTTNGGTTNGGTVSNGGSSATSGGSVSTDGGAVGSGGGSGGANSAGDSPGGTTGETGGGNAGGAGGAGDFAGAGGQGGASAGSPAGGVAGDTSPGGGSGADGGLSTSDDGCRCRFGARSQGTPLKSLAIFGLALIAVRRRSARRRAPTSGPTSRS